VGRDDVSMRSDRLYGVDGAGLPFLAMILPGIFSRGPRGRCPPRLRSLPPAGIGRFAHSLRRGIVPASVVVPR